MTRNLLRVSVTTLLLLACRPALADIVFTEGFETGTTNWSLGGKWTSASLAHSGSASLTFQPGKYGSYGYTDATLHYSATTRGSMATIRFWVYHSSAIYDYLDFQIGGGGDWTTYRTYSANNSGGWKQETVTLSLYPTFSLRFRAYINSSYTEHEYDYWYVDDIEIDDGARSIVITAPVASTDWEVGTSQTIAWTYDGSIAGASSLAVATSTDGGSTWTGLADKLPTSTSSVNWTVPAVSTTKARIRVQVLDSGGAVLATVFSSNFTIGYKLPSAPTPDSPPNGRCASDTPSFSWSAVSGATAYGLTITSPNCELCKSFSKTVTSTSYTLAYGERLSTDASPFSWTVHAIDDIGRSGPSSEPRILYLDTKGPEAFSLVSPADAAKLSSGTPTLAWTAAPDVRSPIARYDVYVDRVLKGSTDAATLSFTPAELTAGVHTWYVRTYNVCNAFRDSHEAFTFTVAGPPCVAGTSEPCGSGVNVCRPGTRTCSSSGEWGACVGQIFPFAEICNGLDDDCDGLVDEDLASCASQPSLDAGSISPAADASVRDAQAAAADSNLVAADASLGDRPMADAASTPSPQDAGSIVTPTGDAASTPGPRDTGSIVTPTGDAASTPAARDSGIPGPVVVDASGGLASPDAPSRVPTTAARGSHGCSFSTSSSPNLGACFIAALLLLRMRRRRC